MKDAWLKNNTFHHSAFKRIEQLVEAKSSKKLKISLCLPTLNEEKTIAKEIVVMKSELMTRYPLLDEIVVIDSGSTDKTREIAAAYGVDVREADDILPDLEQHRGKGENLWKALYVTQGDIIVYIDADIKNIHHRFAYGLLGPLLLTDTIKYVKAFYDRPIADEGERLRPTGGGRVTELVIRPLFSLFYPALTQILQPLSGEYAGYREIFENVSFPIGYGVETSLILDIYERWGLDVFAQVDLDRRVHRNQSTKALGVMAFVIMKTFIKRIENQGHVRVNRELFREMIQYHSIDGEFSPEKITPPEFERPPIIDIPAYRERFGINDPPPSE
jgi:glucosyl-3-phosphoglycerate synthase